VIFFLEVVSNDLLAAATLKRFRSIMKRLFDIKSHRSKFFEKFCRSQNDNEFEHFLPADVRLLQKSSSTLILFWVMWPLKHFADFLEQKVFWSSK
jgi:hypothetical protein